MSLLVHTLKAGRQEVQESHISNSRVGYCFIALGEEVPPHPGPGWTRFVCISDTHSRRYRVPSGDVLLHAGDLSSWGSFPQLTTTVEWLKTLDHPVKILIAGNHDLCLDQKWGEYGNAEVSLTKAPSSGYLTRLIQRARAYMHSHESVGMYYIEHEPLQFTSPSGRVWKAYGSPAAPVYVEGAFQYASPTEAKGIYNRIPNDTEILLTHTPPYKILDTTKKGSHAGCRGLLYRLNRLKYCRLHVFGHIHEAAGSQVDNAEGVPRVSANAAMQRCESAVVVDLRD
ncbi:Metallo-dependent phosphatase [Melanogaster broomeanus]|nr:Metallo-dependent phosphatase [Melanogaster broomeanus]